MTAIDICVTAAAACGVALMAITELVKTRRRPERRPLFGSAERVAAADLHLGDLLPGRHGSSGWPIRQITRTGVGDQYRRIRLLNGETRTYPAHQVVDDVRRPLAGVTIDDVFRGFDDILVAVRRASAGS